MSRTFRRKGYEAANMAWKDGTKIAGYYTATDWNYIKVQELNDWHFESYKTYRKPTRQEHNKEYWRIHGDSHRNYWSPSRSYRNARMEENRTLTKNEIIKFMKDTDHEVMVEANPRSCLWDWR
jgi:hypothetical protein